MFNTLMKSGTNDFHGVAFGSTRQTDWSGNNFLNNAAGLPLPPQWNYTYAFALGGRVWIPKIYDGKNRTFFWIAREGYDDTQSNSSQLYTPTALERVGNFSQTIASGGGPLNIYNPASTIKNADGTFSRALFPGNIIPSQYLNTVGLNIANTLALPATTPAYYGANDLTVASSLPARAHQTTFKVEEQFTNWWHSNFSYLSYLSLEPGNTYFNSISSPDQWRLLAQRQLDSIQQHLYAFTDACSDRPLRLQPISKLRLPGQLRPGSGFPGIQPYLYEPGDFSDVSGNESLECLFGHRRSGDQ